MKVIPLRDMEGAVRAYAQVDDDDFEAMNAVRWHLAPTRGNLYVRRKVGGRQIHMHSVLMGTVGDRTVEVDHIDGNGLNNQRSNLRLVNRAGNAQNRRKLTPGHSRHRGVTRHKRTGKWQAQAQVAYKTHYIGSYNTEEEAVLAVSEFRRQHMPYSNEEMHT